MIIGSKKAVPAGTGNLANFILTRILLTAEPKEGHQEDVGPLDGLFILFFPPVNS